MIKKFSNYTNLKSSEKWDLHYLKMAELVGKKSKDPSTGVGAVIVDGSYRTISTGYNGLPQKINDCKSILENRESKLKQIIHAEENAIIFAKRDLTDCVIYIWPLLSCSSCASKIIQAGIIKVVTITSNEDRWKKSFDISRKSFKHAEVELIEYDYQSYNRIKGDN